jgi:hypothetical protein
MRNSRAITTAILAVGFTALVTACATGPGGPEEEGPPPGPGRGGRGMGPAQPREDGASKQYDVNGDGKVTRAEFLAVRALCFVRYDANEAASSRRPRSGGASRADWATGWAP